MYALSRRRRNRCESHLIIIMPIYDGVAPALYPFRGRPTHGCNIPAAIIVTLRHRVTIATTSCWSATPFFSRHPKRHYTEQHQHVHTFNQLLFHGLGKDLRPSEIATGLHPDWEQPMKNNDPLGIGNNKQGAFHNSNSHRTYVQVAPHTFHKMEVLTRHKSRRDTKATNRVRAFVHEIPCSISEPTLNWPSLSDSSLTVHAHGATQKNISFL